MEKRFGIAVKAIIKKGDEYLVLFKSDIEDINPNEIDIPGGRIEFGENIEEALKREIKEELGIEIAVRNPSRVWGFVKEDLHLIGITFLADYLEGKIVLSGEHRSYKWVTKDAALRGSYPKWIKNEFNAL